VVCWVWPAAARCGGARGRPARYHGPACRQRARRARLGVDPERARLLTVAQRAEHAALALRRAVTTDQGHQAAVAQLLAAAEALTTTLGGGAHGAAAAVCGAATPQGRPVTESVTDSVSCPTAADPAGCLPARLGDPANSAPSRPGNRWRGGAPGGSGGHRRSMWTPCAWNAAPASGPWRVLAGSGDGPGPGWRGAPGPRGQQVGGPNAGTGRHQRWGPGAPGSRPWSNSYCTTSRPPVGRSEGSAWRLLIRSRCCVATSRQGCALTPSTDTIPGGFPCSVRR